ncbi:death-associated inhibitor of apoptosis 1-like [Culicoides brevitarsis]|uniref:death-associated inhibitor of apoptosis 1-like n=1 Tax=Culicoides brevitarsis TaxID=469753 RepID=UPI00307C1F77
MDCLTVVPKRIMKVARKSFNNYLLPKRSDEVDNNKDNKVVDVYMSNDTRRSPQTITPSPPPASPRNAPATHNKEKNRLATFNNWHLTTTDKRLLAQIGFYYTGTNDLVKCFFCNVEIGMWQPEDNPVDEHLRWSPNCPLLHGRETSNEPIDAEALKRILPQISYDTCGIRANNSSQSSVGSGYAEISVNHANPSNIRDLSPQPSSSSSQERTPRASLLSPARAHEHPEFAIESHRLISFEDWPKTMKQKPKELAEAGFYYTGKGDRVACFSCGGGLKDWEEMDVPWEQHAMWYSKCEYLKLMKGQEFIDEILARKSSPPSSFTEPSTLAACGSSASAAKEAKASDEPAKCTAMSCDDQKPPMSDSKMCKICYECEYNTAFFPCGHIIACAKCASSVTKCPYCRQPFTKVMRVYFS